MIIAVIKENVNGKWRDLSKPIYEVGQIVRTPEGKKLKVTNINGSKVTFEEI